MITLVIHFGADEWDGPLSLHDMMDVPDKHLLKFIQDYQVHLIEPAKLTEADLKKFSTNLGDVLGYIKYSNDKKQLRAFIDRKLHKLIDVNAARVIQAVTHTSIELPKENEVINVCKAIDEMMEDSRLEGKLETLANLVQSGLLSLSTAATQADMTEDEFLKETKKFKKQ